MHDRKRRIGRAPTPIRRRLDSDRHRSQRRRTSQQPAAITGRRLAHCPFEQLAHHPKAEPALQLVPTPPQHPHTVRSRARPSCLQQARLADPSMPLHKHQRPRPGRNRGQLDLAPEQRARAPHCRKTRARMANRVARTGALRLDIRRCTGHLRFPSAPRHTRAAQTLGPILCRPPPLVNALPLVAQHEPMRRPPVSNRWPACAHLRASAPSAAGAPGHRTGVGGRTAAAAAGSVGGRCAVPGAVDS